MADQQLINMLLHARRMAKNDPSNTAWQKQVEALEFRVHNGDHPPTEEVPAPPPDLPEDFSPAEVQDAEGYQKLELQPVELPHHGASFKNFFSGPVENGLNVSKKRYYGCHLLEKRQESALLWIEQAGRVAKHYGCSERLIAMAGHAMLDQWVMLPTANMKGVDDKDMPDFVMPPDVPYNETEQEVWKKCFEKYHFVGVYVMAHTLHGGAVVAPDGKMIPRTTVPTVTNKPHWIAYALNQTFETGHYKTRAFRVALQKAHDIDRHQSLPVAGYVPRRIFDWADEPTEVAKTPRFVAEPEF